MQYRKHKMNLLPPSFLSIDILQDSLYLDWYFFSNILLEWMRVTAKMSRERCGLQTRYTSS